MSEMTDDAADVERIARAICKVMNIDPDGCNSAHKLHSVQDRLNVDGCGRTFMETRSNWQAAEHVERAAREAMAR